MTLRPSPPLVSPVPEDVARFQMRDAVRGAGGHVNAAPCLGGADGIHGGEWKQAARIYEEDLEPISLINGEIFTSFMSVLVLRRGSSDICLSKVSHRYVVLLLLVHPSY